MHDKQALADGRATGDFSGRPTSLHSEIESQVTAVTSMWREERSVIRDVSGEVQYPGQLEELAVTKSFQCITCGNSGPKSLYGHPEKETNPTRQKHLGPLRTTNRAGKARLAGKDWKVPLQVKYACSECRRRKQRCSGEHPSCQFCDHRELTCSYEVADGLTRSEDLKRRAREATCRADNLEKIFKAMQSGTSEDSTMLLAQMRLGTPIEQLLSTATQVHDVPIAAKLERLQEASYCPSSEGAVKARGIYLY
jgi:hypothetical protein